MIHMFYYGIAPMMAQVAVVPAAPSASSRARRESVAAPAYSTPLALRALLPGKGSLRGVYLKRIAVSKLYQGFYPSSLIAHGRQKIQQSYNSVCYFDTHSNVSWISIVRVIIIDLAWCSYVTKSFYLHFGIDM